MSIRHYLALIAVAAGVTVALTPLVRALSLKYGLVDQPGGRKVHEVPISRLGGIAIFAGVMAALAVELVGELYFGWTTSLIDGGTMLLGVLAGMLVIFAIGLLDDIVSLQPGAKLIGQLTAASIVLAAGLRIDFVGNPTGGGLISLGLLGIPVTLIYIVGFTNVINLIDGLDGLAAGVSAIAGTSLLVLAARPNHFESAILAAALIGACLGFLRFNFNPASIFMGDSGSMFLGFALATISLLGVMKSVAAVALAVPLMVVGVPIFDTASAIVRRLLHKRPIQEADRGHIHHRLLRQGFNQRQTVVLIYIWSVVLAVGAYSIRYAPTIINLITFTVLGLLTAFMAYWLGLFEAAHHHGDDNPDET